MRLFILLVVSCLAFILLPVSCIDPEDSTLRGTVDVIVVDGTITNLAEPQIIRLNRSQADRLTGRFGTSPITKATVEVVVDSVRIVLAHETIDGSYQLPSDFKGQIGHAYQLRFTLSDGTHYESTQEVMSSVPLISKVSAKFNPASLPAQLTDGTLNLYRGAHEVSIDWQDPVNEHNYYRWDWKLWEKQVWCRSCIQGEYAMYQIVGGDLSSCFRTNDQLYEDCYAPIELRQPPYNYGGQNLYFVYDYNCRTQCWEIIHNYAIDVFDDKYSNGGSVQNRKVAQIPFYQREGCLIEVRQLSMTADAYRYFKLFQDQTQNTGGLADTPPTIPVGNVHNVADSQENVVGYFTASAASMIRYWIDRNDATGESPGLFQALNGRDPIPEPDNRKFCIVAPPVRPPTAVCVSSESRTPYKPEGWQE